MLSSSPPSTWWTGTSLDFSNFPQESVQKLSSLATTPHHFCQKYVLSNQRERLVLDIQSSLTCERDYALDFVDRIINYFQNSYLPKHPISAANPPPLPSSSSSTVSYPLLPSQGNPQTDELGLIRTEMKQTTETLTKLVESFNTLYSFVESFHATTTHQLQAISDRVSVLEQHPTIRNTPHPSSTPQTRSPFRPPPPSPCPPPLPPNAPVSSLPPTPSQPPKDRPRGLFGRDSNCQSSPQTIPPTRPSQPPPLFPTHHCTISQMVMTSSLNQGVPLRCETNSKQIGWAATSNSATKPHSRKCYFVVPPHAQQGVLSLSLTPYFRDGDSVDVGVVLFQPDSNEALNKKNSVKFDSKGKLMVRGHSEKVKPITPGDRVKLEIDFSSHTLCIFVNDLPLAYKITGFHGDVHFFVAVSCPNVRVELEECRNEAASALLSMPPNYHPTKTVDFSKHRSFF
ncbi:hypothetical protein BLNAU_12779 [Blattamonas nauphoetae]|uniref:NHR domain-containing protein n=1 Tax=Blattamonas nauphoetae TaxID=2049346 RepID=A0ABQ9XL76_9EUKA|nr:hypothetical protein BLNAU_12779 [Blattamonas nauphoetae]